MKKSKSKRFYVAVAASVFAAIIILAGTGEILKVLRNKMKLQKFETTVTRVFDGDTILIKEGNRKVRLKGIDTPELHHPDVPVQAHAEEAFQYLKKRILNKKITVEYNKDEMNDIYGRMLAYIYIDDEMINAELVKKGYAYVYRKKPCIRTNDFDVLENVARQFRRGVWEHDTGGQVKP